MSLPVELDSRQKMEVETLVEGARLEASPDAGLCEEGLYQLFQESASHYGDFTPQQIEELFYEFRKSILHVGEAAVTKELFKAS